MCEVYVCVGVCVRCMCAVCLCKFAIVCNSA